ncbi:MAG: endo-1,4-beta-xylanase [candidate division KSB1 bacterium]|nr:endo-1,4-beta-xylanase [candidate division KSB1 bacterium]
MFLIKHRMLLVLFVFPVVTLFAAEPWTGLEQARERINKIRKAELGVRVFDADGNPLPDANVTVSMQKHAFPFGCAISATNAFTPEGPDPDMQTYLEIFQENFNEAIIENGMKWTGMNNHDGSVNTLTRMKTWQCISWLERNDIPLRGTNVLWPSWQWSPKYLHDLRLQPEILKREIDRHVDEALNMYRGHLIDWDFVNEPVHHRDFINIFGRDIMIDWYKRAHELNPKTNMYVNQWAVLNDVYHNGFKKWIRYLLAHPETSLDGIGIQGHMTVEQCTDSTTLAAVWSKLNEYAEFGLPIKITEYDVEGFRGEDLQAEALKNALTLFFSHPAVQGFTIWGFWDGRHWRNMPQFSFAGVNEKAGFWRQDWSEKPAAKTWQRLIFDEWWTQVSGQTDEDNGTFRTRGFLGDYQIMVVYNNNMQTTSLSLSHDGARVRVEFP